MAKFTDDNIKQIRMIVREETDDMRRDIQYIKKDITQINISLDNLDNKLSIFMEAASQQLNLDLRVKNHESRIGLLETNNKLTKQTLTIHSKKLKSLGTK